MEFLDHLLCGGAERSADRDQRKNQSSNGCRHQHSFLGRQLLPHAIEKFGDMEVALFFITAALKGRVNMQA
jgi:hypothetical protein